MQRTSERAFGQQRRLMSPFNRELPPRIGSYGVDQRTGLSRKAELTHIRSNIAY